MPTRSMGLRRNAALLASLLVLAAMLGAGTAAWSARGARSWAPIVTGAGSGTVARWRLPLFGDGMAAPSTREPAHGRVGSVVIPAVRSGFHARRALVYLPPAALGGHLARLPVVIVLSGQSRGAGPADVFGPAPRAGDLAARLDGIAAAHGGRAPIVVVPDQLGTSGGNPMCVDSVHYGHVATYIVDDVRTWIQQHLPARTDRADRAIAGFSEGGTCAIQFGAADPAVFGALIDVSGELKPLDRTVARSVRLGFGGDAAAYRAASPMALLARHDYRALGTQAFFAAGARDRIYGPVSAAMADHARAAGMTAHRMVVPDRSHDWTVGADGLAWGIAALERRWART